MDNQAIGFVPYVHAKRPEGVHAAFGIFCPKEISYHSLSPCEGRKDHRPVRYRLIWGRGEFALEYTCTADLNPVQYLPSVSEPS